VRAPEAAGVAGGDAAIDIRDAIKSFGALRALDGVSLRVRRGEIYALLGPNGAGKTTLIRTILGLVRLDGGDVDVLGTCMPNSRVTGQIGYMTQKAALYPELSVRENLEFFAGIHGTTHSLDDALRLVELDRRASSVVSTLSGGMQQRLSLACALVHRPQLLLLDEPTVGIDPQLRMQFWGHFRSLAGEGTTIVISSHVMDEAGRADRLGLLRFGHMLAEGTVDELRARAGTDTLEEAFLRLSAAPETDR
jgi:ABC-2 type transport system ATP-binding protein